MVFLFARAANELSFAPKLDVRSLSGRQCFSHHLSSDKTGHRTHKHDGAVFFLGRYQRATGINFLVTFRSFYDTEGSSGDPDEVLDDPDEGIDHSPRLVEQQDGPT